MRPEQMIEGFFVTNSYEFEQVRVIVIHWTNSNTYKVIIKKPGKKVLPGYIQLFPAKTLPTDTDY
jgi:hypothetical protein